MDVRKLPLANVLRHPGRTAGLVVLVALLAFTMLGGALMVSSLRTGLGSLEDRLGADIIVAPDTAKSTTDLESIVLDGTPGSFYMDKGYVEKVRSVPGVEQASPQYYLATMKAGCCSARVQVIGFDPETDFSIQPWIARSYADDLNFRDIVVGASIEGAIGTTTTFFDRTCTIVAKLDETGTSLDTAVFTTSETVKDLIAGSVEKGATMFAEQSPDDVVSTVQVKVADDANVSDVADYINIHVRGATAVQTKSMLSGVSNSMAGISGVITVLMVVVWVLAAVMLVVAFLILGKHRAREFAVLRVVGASRRMLSGIVIRESLIVSFAGAVIGIVVALVVTLAFSTALENALGVPFLSPGVPTTALFILLAFVIALVAGPLASMLSARRLSRVDTGQILREE